MLIPMSALQLGAIVVCLVVSTVGWLLLFRTVYRYVRLFRSGAPDPTRTGQPGQRTLTLLREFLGHTRMARLPIVAIAHWVTAISFLVLFSTLVNAFLQLFDAAAVLPIIGHFPPFEWVVEFLAWGAFFGILYLIYVRQRAHPRRNNPPRRSRFFGSTWWQAYYVEFTILAVGMCIVLLRTLEAQLTRLTEPDVSIALHFPLTGWLSGMWSGLSEEGIRETIYFVAAVKILVSFAWMITIALTPTMGVAWHRFLAFFNIWFKRHPNGRTSLGALQPMKVDGREVTAENLEEVMEGMGEDEESEPVMGVGRVDQFTWKGLLDFTTCTECGRCQSQCPAWNTDKPLSPKLLVMTMRDHAHAQAPYLLASSEAKAGVREEIRALADVPLVGATGYSQDAPLSAYTSHGPDAVIDEDVLWSCTSCGACVEQCPVDIEHVDAIVDMRRHKVLIESAFPAELGGLFKNMESRQNPWGMASKLRMDWAKGLPFDVPVVGSDVESLEEVDYLFWVGCAGAYEDRAKKTTRAVAELLHTAGVTFAVLGEGEACTGDSARRAGNEILFQMLAAQNVETLREAGATKIVVTCAHCFNTIRNEYPQIGGKFEVVHHTQLLNQLVRAKRLVPVARPGAASTKDVASTGASVTYHDPCYLGRHNHVYAPPRELLGALPGVELREMPRHGEKSFCCGAGGARMWMEEKLGTRINANRTAEAVATGAERIAVGCPFCRVMLSDGLTAQQAEGTASAEVEVVDVAQMLLAAVRQQEAGTDQPSAVAAPASTPATQRPSRPSTPVEAPAAAAPAATAAPAAPAPAKAAPAPAGQQSPAKAGAMSASDALAALQPKSAAAPSGPAATPAKPGGAVSAGDALAAMLGQTAKPAAETPAPATPAKPGGAVSAGDALAAMLGQTAKPAAETPAPATPAPKAGGAVSASDALAAMLGQTAKPAPAAPAPKASGAVSASDALAAMQAQAAGASSSQQATPPAPAGKMSAGDALAAMLGQTAKPAAETPAPAAPTTQQAAPPAAPAAPAGKMSASDALAAMLQTGTPAAAPPASAAPAQSEPSVQAPAPAAAAGKMSASDALAAMLGQAAKPATETPAASPAPAAPTPPATAPAASPAAAPAAPSGKMSASDALAALRAGAAGGAPAGPTQTAETSSAPAAPAPTQSASAAPTPPASATPRPAPSGERMSASDALAMLLAEGRESAPPTEPAAPQRGADAPPAPDEDSAVAGASGDAPEGKLPSAAEALKMLQGK